MKQYIIVDLDNCICDDEQRLTLVDWDAKDVDKRWHAYHTAAFTSTLRNPSLLDTPYGIIIATARPEKFREVTENWLKEWKVNYDFLFMRMDGDHSSAVEVKRQFIQNLDKVHGINRRDIVIAYDDREDICQMYREVGIKSHRVWIHEKTTYGQPGKDYVPDAKPKPVVPQPQMMMGRPVISPSNVFGGFSPVRAMGDSIGECVDCTALPSTPPPSSDPAAVHEILHQMADTFLERNKQYGSNFKMVGPIMAILFPQGVPVELLQHDAFHLFELMIVKISRLAISRFTHIDSAHDAAVYSAMIESIIRSK